MDKTTQFIISADIERTMLAQLELFAAGYEAPIQSWPVAPDERDADYHVLLLRGTGRDNLAILEKLDTLAEKGGTGHIHAAAFVDSGAFRFGVHAFPHIDADVYAAEQIAVRTFLQNHLPIDRMKDLDVCDAEDGIWLPREPFTLCVAGTDALAQEFLLQTCEYAAFEMAGTKDCAVQISVIGDCTELRKAVPQLWTDGILREYPEGTDPRDISEHFTQIFAAGGDMHAAQALREQFPDAQIVCPVERAADDVPEGITPLYADVISGSVMPLVNRDPLHELEALHRKELGRPLHDGNWSSLTTFERQSKSAVVYDMPNKRAIACTAKPEDEDAFLWRLSEYEHRRWNMFHYTRGWQSMSVSDLTEEERARGVTKHLAEKRHICLVPWEELDGLPQKEPGYLRRLDYDNVAGLFGKKS